MNDDNWRLMTKMFSGEIICDRRDLDYTANTYGFHEINNYEQYYASYTIVTIT